MTVVLVVDVANVVGSVPDGWWRDRAGAAQRLLARLAGLAGAEVDLPDGGRATLARVVAVVEGVARAVADQPGVEVVRAVADGDGAIVEVVAALSPAEHAPLVVTADRGLRSRLPGVACAGPRWLLDRLPPAAP